MAPIVIHGRALIDGVAQGRALKLSRPLSFWGGVSAASGEIVQGDHPERGQIVSDRVLVVPGFIGSSSSSAVLLELLHGGRAPLAVVTGAGDAILPLACVVAREMGWPTIPIVEAPIDAIPDAAHLAITPGGQLAIEPPNPSAL